MKILDVEHLIVKIQTLQFQISQMRFSSSPKTKSSQKMISRLWINMEPFPYKQPPFPFLQQAQHHPRVAYQLVSDDDSTVAPSCSRVQTPTLMDGERGLESERPFFFPSMIPF